MFCRETDISVSGPDILIIGYGNSMRADDGAGPALIEQLDALLAQKRTTAVRLIACPQLMPELAADISEARKVLFVDASVAVKPGRVRITRVEPDAVRMTMGHHFSPTSLLSMAGSAFGACPAAWVAEVGCESLEMDDRLSDRTAATVERLARHLMYHLARRPGSADQALNDGEQDARLQTMCQQK